ncbi:hypothetical protein ANN_01735 [Periplaneta americana]|uniref:Uncharacterized protein n=1 Tax=Periplaneta americana TaxID=6978 RepID=A0ABQ8TYG9_PERAM|nr:hypothetical protein ANN_01735 [Periplaneta americana]
MDRLRRLRGGGKYRRLENAGFAVKDLTLDRKSGMNESHEGPRATSRLLASRPHAEAKVDGHPTRMEERSQEKEILAGQPPFTEQKLLQSTASIQKAAFLTADWMTKASQSDNNRCNSNYSSSTKMTSHRYKKPKTMLKDLVCAIRVSAMRPLMSELNSSCQHLSLPCPVELRKSVTRKLREELRNAEFELWKVMPGRGRGVELYSQVPKANAWIFNKSGLSTSEWVTCLKMNANLTAVRGVPGRSLDGSRCRHGCPETETLAHVQEKVLDSRRGSFCLATNGSSRRIDIIAYSQTTKKGYIIDPTIRIETGSSQPEDANQEKINIYLPTVDYFKAKYQLEDIEVIGLLIGARGVIPKFFERFRKTFELPQTLTADIITSVLKRSCQILSHHIHSV